MTVTTAAPVTTADLPQADAVMSQSRTENFTVASAVLGRDRQRHLRAIYGFARLVDDVGDEATGDRGALLDLVECELDAIYAGGRPSHPVMVTLAESVRACRLPADPLRRLIEANRRDQVVTRYATFGQLLGYCQLSAAPVGELVLHVFGVPTPDRIALSDRICAGLQITEHLQDVTEDYGRGRVYVPAEDLDRWGYAEAELASRPWVDCRPLMVFEAQRARHLLAAGAPLARTLSPTPRMAVAGFVAGGREALRRLETGTDGRSSRSPRRAPAFVLAFAKAVAGR
jgi:squalene synthase HpnC